VKASQDKKKIGTLIHIRKEDIGKALRLIQNNKKAQDK